MTKNILMVVTNVDYFGDGKTKTGLWFEEFAVPFNTFLENGYHIKVASLLGGRIPIDPASENLSKDIKWHDAKNALENTERLIDVNYTIYDAIVFPGGHGPMFDIAESELVGEIVSYFDRQNKLIAAICHGPAALLKAKTEDNYIIAGVRVTSFTNDEEVQAKKEKLVPFSLEDELKSRGAFFISQPAGEINVIVDENIITAQNAKSSQSFADTIVKYFEN